MCFFFFAPRSLCVWVIRICVCLSKCLPLLLFLSRSLARSLTAIILASIWTGQTGIEASVAHVYAWPKWKNSFTVSTISFLQLQSFCRLILFCFLSFFFFDNFSFVLTDAYLTFSPIPVIFLSSFSNANWITIFALFINRFVHFVGAIRQILEISDHFQKKTLK